MIDFSQGLAELAEKEKEQCRLGSKLDRGQGGETTYLIQSRLLPLEIVRRESIAANLHRIRCASWRNRAEDQAWNK